MTQTALGQATGIHQVTIAKYETGKISPRMANAIKLAEALGVSVTDLYGKGA
jgi:DNA-binding XRE family transcriptional regulator